MKLHHHDMKSCLGDMKTNTHDMKSHIFDMKSCIGDMKSNTCDMKSWWLDMISSNHDMKSRIFDMQNHNGDMSFLTATVVRSGTSSGRSCEKTRGTHTLITVAHNSERNACSVRAASLH